MKQARMLKRNKSIVEEARKSQREISEGKYGDKNLSTELRVFSSSGTNIGPIGKAVIQVHETKGFSKYKSDLPKMLQSYSLSKGASEKQLKPSFLHHNHNAYQRSHSKSRSKFNMLNLDVNIE